MKTPDRVEVYGVKVPATPRNCLKCGKEFPSTGNHHRLCERCNLNNLRVCPQKSIVETER